MLNSTILDVAIGIVFCFASVALFASAINEAIASLLKLRHSTLLEGIKGLLNDPAATDLALKLYNHALVSPLALSASAASKGKDATLVLPKKLPAYIPSRDFASALIDVIQGAPGDMASFTAAVSKIDDPQLKQLLLGFASRAGTDLEKVRDLAADWFDNAMNRLSGSYKRKTQLMTFIIGFAIAAILNIDTFHVLTELWARPSIAAVLSSPASASMISKFASLPTGAASSVDGHPNSEADLTNLKGVRSVLGSLPVGWEEGQGFPPSQKGWWFYIALIAGWFVTASAAVFGAPFWFDVLQKLIQVRGTGGKPPADRDKAKEGVLSTSPR